MKISRELLVEKKSEGSASGSCSILTNNNISNGKVNEISFSSCSIGGWENRNQRKINQDDWVIAWDADNDDEDIDNESNNKDKNEKEDDIDKQIKMFYGFVFDGHGQDGAAVSSFLRRVLPVVIQTKVTKMIKDYDLNENSKELFDLVLKESFIHTNNILCQLPSGIVETSYSGSAATGIIMLEFMSKIYFVSSNSGDSRTVWARKNKNKWEIINYSKDHKPDREDEEMRINKMNGRVTRGSGVARVGGYALSRAFGDTSAHSAGLIVEPEVIVTEFQNEDEIIVILGSDGIWDFVSSEEAINIFGDNISKNSEDITKACDLSADSIVSLSSLRWKDEYQSYVDDCTAMCLHIRIPRNDQQAAQKPSKSKL